MRSDTKKFPNEKPLPRTGASREPERESVVVQVPPPVQDWPHPKELMSLLLLEAVAHLRSGRLAEADALLCDTGKLLQNGTIENDPLAERPSASGESEEDVSDQDEVLVEFPEDDILH